MIAAWCLFVAALYGRLWLTVGRERVTGMNNHQGYFDMLLSTNPCAADCGVTLRPGDLVWMRPDRNTRSSRPVCQCCAKRELYDRAAPRHDES